MASIVEIIFKTVKQGNGDKETVKGLGDMVKGMAGAVGGYAALGSAALAAGRYLMDSSKAAAANAEVMAKQDAILKATGYAAGLTAGELAKMAGEMERLYHIDGDLISQSQSLMLTFRNIGSETFPRAMDAAINLQTTFGSLEASSMQLGVALNDPISGMGRLAKSGVTFSEQQKEQIKNFVAVNDLASAQAVILSEVENQVGGTAKAIAEAGDGSQNLTNATGALSEAIGKGVLPHTRAWNEALAELAWGLVEVVEKGNANVEVAVQIEKIYGLTHDQLMRAATSSKKFAQEVENTRNQLKSGAEYTELATAQYKAMGGSLTDLSYYGKQASDSIAEVEENTADLTKTNREYLDLVGSMADAEASYTEKQEGFAKKRAELETELATLRRQGYWEQGEQIQGTLGKLEELTSAEQKAAEEFELAGRRRILSMLEQQLSMDGLTTVEMDYLLSLGNQWGIYSDTAVAEAQKAIAEIEKLSHRIITLPDGRQIVIDLLVAGGERYQAQQGNTPQSAQEAQNWAQNNAGFAGGTGGAWMTVPSGYPNDSYRVGLTSGEKINVQPAGQSAGMGGGSGPVELSPGSIAALAQALSFQMQAAGIGQ